jgi:hypothetical protein
MTAGPLCGACLFKAGRASSPCVVAPGAPVVLSPPLVVLEMTLDVASFVVAALRTYGGLSAEKGLPSYTESAEALADKIERSIWEAGKATR